MGEPWTEERHAEVRARCEAAAKGPWNCQVVQERSNPRNANMYVYSKASHLERAVCWGPLISEHVLPDKVAKNQANMILVSKSRIDLDEALDEIERLQALLKQQEEDSPEQEECDGPHFGNHWNGEAWEEYERRKQ